VKKDKNLNFEIFMHIDSGKSRQAKLQEDTYFRALKILGDNPLINQRELSKQLGLSLGGINYCLKALINKGYIKVQNFNANKRKFGYAYFLTPKGIAEKSILTYLFLQRKLNEYDVLRAEIEDLKLDVKASELAKDDPKRVGIEST